MKRVSAAVVFQEDKVLIARRNPMDSLGGYWEFPGGKFEGDETPSRIASKRDLKGARSRIIYTDNIVQKYLRV